MKKWTWNILLGLLNPRWMTLKISFIRLVQNAQSLQNTILVMSLKALAPCNPNTSQQTYGIASCLCFRLSCVPSLVLKRLLNSYRTALKTLLSQSNKPTTSTTSSKKRIKVSKCYTVRLKMRWLEKLVLLKSFGMTLSQQPLTNTQA